MSSGTHHAEIKAAETSTRNGKRQRPDEVEERTYCLNDSELLNCPLCLRSLHSVSIYQCGDGHIACSACCDKVPKGLKCPTCSQPTGKMMRCIFLEKFLASLQVRCKYAPHGCERKSCWIDDISSHETDCRCMPFPCSFAGCAFKGSWITTPEHLTKVHQVRTVEYSNIIGAGFTMKPSDRIVMVKFEGKRADWRANLIFVHREPLHETFRGDVFFCTSGASFSSDYIDLKVAYQVAYENLFYSARLQTISVGSAREYLKRAFLLLPLGYVSPVGSGVERLIEDMSAHKLQFRTCNALLWGSVDYNVDYCLKVALEGDANVVDYSYGDDKVHIIFDMHAGDYLKGGSLLFPDDHNSIVELSEGVHLKESFSYER